MPPEPAEIVRKVLEAWGDDDPAALRALAHPEVEIVPDPMWLEQTRPQGQEEAGRFFEEYREDWSNARLENFVTGRMSGAAVMNRGSIVAQVRDGKVVHVRFYLDHDEAVRAAGLD